MMPLMAKHDVSKLPMFFDQASGLYRVCGRIKSDRPKIKIQPFAAFLEAEEFKTAPNMLASMPDYDRYQTGVPILDQGQVGACVAHGSASAVMKTRDLAGQTFVALSPDSLYAQIDNDVDEGSDPADAITALQSKGICTLADVPDSFILESAIPAAAWANAQRFRITAASVYSCANFAELVTADFLGFATILTINVGNNFNPDSSGIVGYTPGFANHCVSGGEAKRTVGGVAQYRIRNSWTLSWGIQGCGWMTARHSDQQPGFEGFAIKYVLLDPQDPTNPPLS